ncbi:MAG: exo-alpha-sialidase [Armatimonadetes bacterium]|nr:exo-alpha-sialidase [Armatimonadota bacterium]
MQRSIGRWACVLTLALWAAAEPSLQPMWLGQEGGVVYVVEHGVLVCIDLKTMQVLARRTLLRGPGPWDNRLVVARSDDGLSFTGTGVTVAEGGGVPDLMYDAQGRLVAIFQYFPQDSEEEFDHIAVAFSTDEGQSWTKPRVISISGLPATAARAPCDPDLVLLADGRVRLYFTCDVHADRRGTPRTLSAVAEDCLSFQLEEGERFADPPHPVLDPSALRIGDTWHLYVPRMAPGAPAYHLVSGDGLQFRRLDDIRVPGVDFRGNVVPVPGGYRFFGCGQPGLSTAFSQDGSQWRPERTRAVPGLGDPAVIRLKDGTYLMVHMERR